MKNTVVTIILTVLSLGLIGSNIWMYMQLKESQKEKIDMEARTKSATDSMHLQIATALIHLDSFKAQKDTVHFYHRTRIERVIKRSGLSSPSDKC